MTASSTGILHTGDVVLLKCWLQGDGSTNDDLANNSGYIFADSLTSTFEAIQVTGEFAENSIDVRPFLYVVVGQLSYTAQRDLRRRRKIIANASGHVGDVDAATVQLRTFEERAKLEASQNLEIIKSKARPVRYGDVIQLQHLRTRQFVSVKKKKAARLLRTARCVELQDGAASAWMRLNPFFRHKLQGEPILFDEQVEIESVKLGSRWNLCWAKCVNSSSQTVYEVNCAKGGRTTGIFFTLYSRASPVDITSLNSPLSLRFSSPLLLQNPHYAGFISASCAENKKISFIRRGKLDRKLDSFNSKDIWVLEVLSTDEKNCGVEYNSSSVLLRHFGSGRYLSLCKKDALQHGLMPQTKAEAESPVSPKANSKLRKSMSVIQAKMNSGSSLSPKRVPQSKGSEVVRTELLRIPTELSVFVLEPASVIEDMDQDSKAFVPNTNACVLIKWEHPMENQPLWLSSSGQHKNSGKSLLLHWSATRRSNDAINFHVLDESPLLRECDIVSEHIAFLRNKVLPRCSEFSHGHTAALVGTLVERALSDMICFVSDSPNWRSTDQQLGPTDALDEPWTANQQRQLLLRELKYIDVTFEFFHELCKVVSFLSEGNIQWNQRHALQNSATSASVSEMAFNDPNSNWISILQTRCLKLLVRVWLFSFLSCNKNENYFFRNGWMNVIDNLNGHGLGASDVFVALVGENPELIRNVDSTTLVKAINFIRMLGPLDTWFNLLKAICAPQGQAVTQKQQEVLCNLVFHGHRSTQGEREIAQRNRAELLINVRLDEPSGLTCGFSPSFGPLPSREECMAHEILVQGIRDIAISWTHPNHWRVGQGVLFHGPHALGLPTLPSKGTGDTQSWVSLAQVAWVLQPEDCCEAATGVSWTVTKQLDENIDAESNKRDSRTSVNSPTSPIASRRTSQRQVHQVMDSVNDFPTSRMELLTMIAKYFLAQLRLLSAMVKERQMNCIMALQEEYSFSLCLSGASDPRLPAVVRGAFYDLLTDLWIDRHPHVQVVVPTILRNLPNSESAPTDDIPSFVLDQEEIPENWSDQHLRSLPEEVHFFFKVNSPHKMDALVHAVHHFLCSGKSLEQQVHSDVDHNIMLVAVLRCLKFIFRYGFIGSVRQVQDMLGPLFRCLDGRTDWFFAPERSQATQSPDDGQHSEGAMLESLRPLLQSDQSNQPPQIFQYPPLDNAAERYIACDLNIDVMACKTSIVQILLHILNYDQHIKITHILHKFSTVARDSLQTQYEMPDSILDDVMHLLRNPVISLKSVGVSSPTVLCTDLLMYDDSNLFARALELLFAQGMPTSELFDYLQRVRVISQVQGELFFQLVNDVSVLGKLIYSFENWGIDDHFSTLDSQKLMQLCRLCLKIRNLCTMGDAATTPREVQDMLRETEFGSHLSYTLSLNYKDFASSCRSTLAKVVNQVCSASQQFCKGNVKNQVLVFANLHDAMALMGESAECALLVSEIFLDNVELCSQVTEEMVTMVAQFVYRERKANHFVPWYLRFLSGIIAPGGQGLPRNQLMVIDCIQKVGPENLLHLLQDANGPSRLRSLASHFRSALQLRDSDPSRWSAADGELIYYIRSVELLVGLARGRGSQSLVHKPFVTSLLPPLAVVQLLLETQGKHRAQANHQFSIHQYMRVRWLQFLHLVLYDVEANLVDIEVLSDPLHVQFFSKLMEWLESLLQVSSDDAQRESSQQSPSASGNPTPTGSADLPLFSEEEEEYLCAILMCIGSFYSGPYHMLRHYSICGALNFAASRCAQRFERLRGTQLHDAPLMVVRDARLLQVTIDRVLNAHCKGQPLTQIRSEPVPATSLNEGMSPLQAQWSTMVSTLRDHPLIQECIKQEEEEIGMIFSCINEFTDPESYKYMKECRNLDNGQLPPGVDFRRNKIAVETLLRRFVSNCNNHKGDLPTLRRVFRALLLMLQRSRGSQDPVALDVLQERFVHAGVTDLIVQMLNAKVASDITVACWNLLAQMLKSRDNSVNKCVQQGLYEACTSIDDSALWESLQETLSIAGAEVKSLRSAKILPSLTTEEAQRVQDACVNLANAVKAMEAMSLMVEGHYFPMQQYLFSQAGNARSCNVPEVACMLLDRLCKHPAAANMVDEQELQCIGGILNLVTELAQGPNLRNQEFLSSLWLVETVFKLLSSEFTHLQTVSGDCYPSLVRQINAKLVGTVLALLEGRKDTEMHFRLLPRIDRPVLRDRIEFVYLYFVFGVIGVSSGEIASNGQAAVPLGTRFHVLLQPLSDPYNVYQELASGSAVAEELLEDLDDMELDELFSEGLDIINLILVLSSCSSEFEGSVVPQQDAEDSAFIDDPLQYPSEREYQMERALYCKRMNYRQAFFFLRRFVSTIEVILDGHLQVIHFQQPLTAMWYCHGDAKDRILNSITLKSADAKAKEFLNMCRATHAETLLVRSLSRFSILPRELRKWGQRHLPDGAHRPFQVLLADDAKKMQQLLRGALALSMVLALHVGVCLVPVKQAQKSNLHQSKFTSATTERIAQTLGGLHFTATLLWLILTTCLKVPLKVNQLKRRGRTGLYSITGALFYTIKDKNWMWRFVLLVLCGLALLEHHWLFCFLVLDFFCQSARLQTVLAGIMTPARSLAMTFLGGIIITFVYASVGFHVFRDQFGDYCTNSIIVCTQNILYQGTRNGIIGLSSMMETTMPGDARWYQRMAYDISYFVVFGIMILNTIVALIVDSFGQQRMESETREAMLENQTFISGIDRKIIEAVAAAQGISDGFEYHEEHRQPKWNYMAFIFHLQEKSATDFTGPEQMIKQLVEANDPKWLPLHRSKMVESDSSHQGKEDILDRIDRTTRSVSFKVDTAIVQRRKLMEKLNSLSRNFKERVELVQLQIASMTSSSPWGTQA